MGEYKDWSNLNKGQIGFVLKHNNIPTTDLSNILIMVFISATDRISHSYFC